MLRTAELDYELPEALIATTPAEPRDSARLLVVRASDDAHMEHATFRDLPEFLQPKDVLVFNTSRVLPARIQGRRRDSGGAVEGLYLGTTESGGWVTMLRSNGTLRVGQEILLLRGPDQPSTVAIVLLRRQDNCWIVRPVNAATGASCEEPAGELLATLGTMPLPPYILRARRQAGVQIPDSQDRAWYQTIYATAGGESASAGLGSVAAPTAGLHFTQPLLSQLNDRGVEQTTVILHVGPGTFKPVEAEFVEEHPMHSEWTEVPPEAIQAIHRCIAARRRCIPVGTTSVRAIESVPGPIWTTRPPSGWAGETDLLITPGFSFQVTAGLITNFHLPRSTLLALVAALFPEGVPRLLAIYREAIRRGYRFYSYGDAMLILP